LAESALRSAYLSSLAKGRRDEGSGDFAVKEPLVVQDVQVDEPQAGEALIKTSASGVCHSDLHFMEGLWPSRPPVVLGHESAGVVEKVGEGVTNVKPGDRVVLSFVYSCGQCERCLQGRPVLCMRTNVGARRGRLNRRPGSRTVRRYVGVREYQLVNASICIGARRRAVGVPPGQVRRNGWHRRGHRHADRGWFYGGRHRLRRRRLT
jgi:NADPH:quinone reductase-like Zn-dependent oxidoreductase